MHLVSQVVFNYDIKISLFHKTGNFSGINELQNAVNEYYTNNDFQSLRIWRTVQIIDKDEPIRPAGMSAFKFYTDKQSVKQYKTIELDKEVLSMHICQKIMYPRDIRKILKQRYGSVLDLDSQNLDAKLPVCDFYVSEQKQYGLRNPKTGAPTEHVLRHVCCRRANSNDLIVDKNLNQIWPTKTKQPPKELLEFLARNTEKVYEE